VHRYFFFISGDASWNICDLVLVALAVYDEAMSIILDQTNGPNLTFMRTARLLKLARVVRILRVIKYFRELRLLVAAIGRSFIHLLWSAIMLVSILYCFSLMLLQGVREHLVDMNDRIDADLRNDLLNRFGSAGTAVLSLYMSGTGGLDWGDLYALLKPTGSFYACIFIFYTAFFTFAVFNILTGMFVDNMRSISDTDDAYLVLQYRREQKRITREIRHLFQEVDADGSGHLTMSELEEAMKTEKGQSILDSLSLDVRDAETFFQMLAKIAGHNRIDAEAFVEGCMRMKGTASSVDLACLSFQTDLLHHELHNLSRSVDQLVRHTTVEKRRQQQQPESRPMLERSQSGGHWTVVDWQQHHVMSGLSL